MSDVAEKIKERIDFVSFIRDYVDLKPAGANFKALCPFHQEKTPSFMVSASKQRFKCFGCGKGGDVFTFLEEYEGIEFPDALTILAEKAGVEIPRFNPKEASARTRLYDIMRLTADYYQLILHTSPLAHNAREYIKKRGIDDMIRDVFKLGFSIAKNSALFDFLRSKKFTEQEIVQSGLAHKTQYGFMDMFRERLIFPIWDEYGRVIGFGGRILVDDKTKPKYINTAQSPVYDKSRVLYGIDKAKDAIRRNNLAVLVEGYMDVIASHSADIKNVVAVSGVALTEPQLKLLSRFTENCALAFDMDNAGIAAALRSYEIASHVGLNTKIVRIPKGKDPDELIRHNATLWQKAIQESELLIDYYFLTTLQNADVTTVVGKKRVRDALLPVVMRCTDIVERSHYLNKLSALLTVSTEELGASYTQESQKRVFVKQNVFHRLAKKESHMISEVIEHIVGLIVTYPHLVPQDKKLPYLSLKNEILHDLYTAAKDAYNTRNITKEVVREWGEKHPNFIHDVSLLIDKDYSELEPREITAEFNRMCDFLNEYVSQRKRQKLLQEIRSAEARGDEQRVEQLTTLLSSLSSL